MKNIIQSIQTWIKVNIWKYIIIFSLIILFFLWIFIASDDTKSSSVHNLNDAITILSVKNENIPTKKPEFVWNENDSKGENVCRRAMIEITGENFYKVRPKWLINPVTNSPLELDNYNESLRIAVEYNGEQHYKYNKFMHGDSKEKFQNQQYRDLIKQDLCKKNNVHLIIVPHYIKLKNIKKFLIKEVSIFLNKRLENKTE